MYANALIGIDELQGGPDAVALARSLTRIDATLNLVRVHGGYSGVARGTSNSIREAERRTAEVALRRASRASGVEPAWAFGATTVGAGFEQLQSYLHADLIVMGSGPTGTLGRTSVPSNFADTISRVSCPVAIAPAGYGRHIRPLRRIGVAFEETREGVQALRAGRHLAANHGARVTVFEGFSTGIEARGFAADAGRRMREFSESVDLLVIGARGGGPLHRMNHRSAPPVLVEGVTAPLLLVSASTRFAAGSADAPVEEQWTSKVSTLIHEL